MERLKINVPSTRKGVASEIVQYMTIVVSNRDGRPFNMVWGRIRGKPIQCSGDTVGKMLRKLAHLADNFENRDP